MLYLLVTFISEFKNTLNSFSNSLFRSILVCKIPQFLQKLLIWQIIKLFQKVETPWGYQKSILCFVYLLQQNTKMFLGSSSWTIWEVEENFIQSFSPFSLLFWWQKKKLLRALLACTFICLLLNPFDFRRYSSTSRKIYTFIRLLCCSCVSKCWGKEFVGNYCR